MKKTKKKLLILAAILLISIPIAGAVVYTLVSYDMTFESLGGSIVLRDNESSVIVEIPVPSLYHGQNTSVYFQLLNLRSSTLSIILNVTFPAGYVMGDSQFGWEINGGGMSGASFGDILEIPVSMFMTLGINIVNVNATLGSSVGSLNVTIID